MPLDEVLDAAEEEVADPTSTEDPDETDEVESLEPEAEDQEDQVDIDWDSYLQDEEADVTDPPPARETETETLTWEQETAKIEQGATYKALEIIQGYLQNQGKLGAFLKDEPAPVQQYAGKQFAKLAPEVRAQPGVAEYLADMALGRKIRMQKQSKASPKSATPRASQPTNLDSATEKEMTSWVARLTAAGMKPADAKKEVASWLK